MEQLRENLIGEDILFKRRKSSGPNNPDVEYGETN